MLAMRPRTFLFWITCARVAHRHPLSLCGLPNSPPLVRQFVNHLEIEVLPPYHPSGAASSP